MFGNCQQVAKNGWENKPQAATWHIPLFCSTHFIPLLFFSLGFLSGFGSSSASHAADADPTANLAGKTRSQFLCKPKQKHVDRLLLICLADC